MWQSTGTEMTIKRRIYGSEQAQKWPICGNQQAHTWQSTGTYMAINRHIPCSQQAHGPYVAVVQVYKRYRDGNKKEQKWYSQ